MTARDIYDAVGIELNKQKTPALLLEDFNYFINKAITQTTNKFFNVYDVSQQTTDDLRVLKSSAKLTPKRIGESTTDIYECAYEVYLPPDYLHMLGVTCEFQVKQGYSCFVKDRETHRGARRMTADQWPMIITNLYNRPSYKMPYYFLHNVNTQNTLSTNPYRPYNATENPIPLGTGTDFNGQYDTSGSNDTRNLASSISANGEQIKLSNTQKEAAYRYGNSSSVRMEIMYGKDSSVFDLKSVMIHYIKSPQFVVLTEEQIDKTIDTSQIIEFPDYVVYEIINNLLHLIMENNGNPRLQTNIPLSQTIAPAQQQIDMQQVKEQIRNM